jgi:Tol biopolymer transport system component
MRTLLVLTGLALAGAPLGAAEPSGSPDTRPPLGTIAFSSVGPRGWDLYVTDLASGQSRRLTDHPALDYNAAFSPDGDRIAFVSERDGNLELYCIRTDGSRLKRLTNEFALDDHPAWSPNGKRIAFVSTRQPADRPGRAWNGVYVMNADGSDVRRLSGADAADYSPAWSPRGEWIAFASGSGVRGGTGLYVMKPDGSGRRRVVEDGGWPTFAADGESLYFHSGRQGKWGIWHVRLDGSGLERVTPPEIEAYTPRAAADGKALVVVVKRGNHRQIELLDLASRKLTAVTREPTDHWNPSLAPDGRSVVYHRTAPDFAVPNVERWSAPPGTGLQLVRLAGAFPAFAPDGKRVALTGGGFASLDVMNLDGSDRKTLYTGKNRGLFSVSWAHSGDLIAFSHGTVFQGPQGSVDLVTVHPDGSDYRKVTTEAGNNGFPSLTICTPWAMMRVSPPHRRHPHGRQGQNPTRLLLHSLQ